MLSPILPINGKALVAYMTALYQTPRSLADTIHPKLCKFKIENQVNGRICDFALCEVEVFSSHFKLFKAKVATQSNL